MRPALSSVLWVAALTGCAGHGWGRFDPAWLSRQAEHPGAAAVYLLDEERIRFDEDPETGEIIAEQRIRLRIQLLHESALPLARIVLREGRFHEVTELRARVTDRHGREHTYGREDARAEADRGVLFTDSHRLILEASAASVGSVLELEYVVLIREPRLFSFGFYFAGRHPEKEARLEVDLPAGFEAEWLVEEGGAVREWAPATELVGDERRLSWVVHDVPGRTPEPLSPPRSARVLQVTVRLARWTEQEKPVAAFRDPEALASWISALGRAAEQNSPEMEALVRSVVAASPGDPRAQARKLHDWVRDEVSYCAIEIGYGGFRPYPADQVFRGRYGDCKGKANLLRSLLALAGIGSDVVLVWSHDGWPRPFRLPTVNNFNHAIVGIDLPGGTVYADPTNTAVPFGELPESDQEAFLLPLRGSGSALVVAPAASAEQNAERVELELRLAPAGEVTGRFSLSRSGALAEELRHSLLPLPVASRARQLERYLGLTGATASGVSFAALSPAEGAAVGAQGSLVAKLPLVHAGAGSVLRLSDVVPAWVPGLGAEPRISAVVLPRRQLREQAISLALPEGLVARPPPPVELECKLGSYRLAWSAEAGKLRMERRLVQRERIVQPADYEELRRFFEAILAAESRPVLFAAP